MRCGYGTLKKRRGSDVEASCVRSMSMICRCWRGFGDGKAREAKVSFRRTQAAEGKEKRARSEVVVARCNFLGGSVEASGMERATVFKVTWQIW